MGLWVVGCGMWDVGCGLWVVDLGRGLWIWDRTVYATRAVHGPSREAVLGPLFRAGLRTAAQVILSPVHGASR